MERKKQLKLLERLIQAHVKDSLFFHLQFTCEELLVMGLKSLSQCLAQKVNPDKLIEKMEWETEKKINEYSKIRATKIIKNYGQNLIK